MTANLGYSDLIASRLQDPDDLQCIETIRNNGRFLVEIINDILDLSKIEADKMDLAVERVFAGSNYLGRLYRYLICERERRV